MGTYGTATGTVIGVNPTTGEPVLLHLVAGEVVLSLIGGDINIAGALTATNAAITGTITATSGSVAGVLTIGVDGGIYQGSGTFATPTTGFKIWNSGGYGIVAGYNGGTQMWAGAYDGLHLRAGGVAALRWDDDITASIYTVIVTPSASSPVTAIHSLNDARGHGAWISLQAANDQGATGEETRAILDMVASDPSEPYVWVRIVSDVANTVVDALRIRHRYDNEFGSGAVANGFGVALRLDLYDDDDADVSASRLRAVWVDKTHATRKARAVWSVYDTTERDGITIEADGTTVNVNIHGETNLNSKRITNLGNATAATDALNRQTADARYAGIAYTDHGALGGLSDDDHSQYLLATGARVGATSQAQTFTNGIIGPSWKPASDSTTALRFQKAAGTAVVTIDTTNSRLGIGVTPEEKLHVAGHVLINNNNRLYWYAADGVSRLTALQLDSSDDLNMVIKNNRSLIIKDASANANTMLKLTDVGTTGNLMVTGKVFAGGTTTPTAFLDAAASTTSAASVRIRSGTAPSAPNAGDLWFDGTNLKFYDGTTTRTLRWT